MTTSSVSCSYEALNMVDGVVLGPTWTEHLSRELLDALQRVSTAAPDDLDGDECGSDVDVAALVFYEVLQRHSSADRWPVFSGGSPRPSLFKAAVLHAVLRVEVAALVRLSPESALAAANVARWMLRRSQQSSPVVVFSRPPGLGSRRAVPAPRQEMKPAALVG